MMPIEKSTKIVNFTTPVAGVLMVRHDHVSHYFFENILLYSCEY